MLTGLKVHLGTISHGTLRTEDLIPAFMDELDNVKAAVSAISKPAAETMERVATVGRIDDMLGAIEQRQEAEDYYESEEAHWDLEALTDALNEFAPPYCYFGSHEGDRADFGFWPCWDQITEERESGELPSGDCTPDDAPEGSLFLSVNERGNAELYRRVDGEWVSVWSCV